MRQAAREAAVPSPPPRSGISERPRPPTPLPQDLPRAQVAPALFRDPLEIGGLGQHAHPADAEELVEIGT